MIAIGRNLIINKHKVGTAKTKGDKAEVFREFQRMISQYQKDPSKYKRTEVPKIPDGSPIGSFE